MPPFNHFSELPPERDCFITYTNILLLKRTFYYLFLRYWQWNQGPWGRQADTVPLSSIPSASQRLYWNQVPKSWSLLWWGGGHMRSLHFITCNENLVSGSKIPAPEHRQLAILASCPPWALTPTTCCRSLQTHLFLSMASCNTRPFVTAFTQFVV